MKRPAARRRSEIPAEVQQQLNFGEIETGSLAEGLAVDFRVLLAQIAPELPAQAIADFDQRAGVTRRMSSAAHLLLQHLGSKVFKRLAEHPADTVRGWAAYVLAATPRLSLPRKLELIAPLADDHHFAVREWAWLALRPQVADQLSQAIEQLIPWCVESSANLRRFASEITRPRGVWCAHISTLKAHPHLGLPLLEPLREDPSIYVQNSVANWLNDAAKSQPEWVLELCARWRRSSDHSPITARICRRACRNLTS